MSNTNFYMLSGEMGSGKSTVANHLSSLGYRVIKADDVAKSVLYSNSDICKTISEILGNDVLQSDGSLNLRKIKNRIFNPNNHKMYLDFESFITDKFGDFLRRNETPGAPYFVEIPPIETSWRIAPYVYTPTAFYIDVDKDEQRKRLYGRGLSDKDIDERLAYQNKKYIQDAFYTENVTGEGFDMFDEPYKRIAADIISRLSDEDRTNVFVDHIKKLPESARNGLICSVYKTSARGCNGCPLQCKVGVYASI